MSEQQETDLRKFLVASAGIARSEGRKAFRSQSDQPEFFKSLLKIFMEQCDLGRAEQNQALTMLKGLVLIAEGNHPDLVEEVLARLPSGGWGDFFDCGLHNPSRLGQFMSECVGPEAVVTLREITARTVGDVCRLSDTLTAPKSRFVAANAFSIAQAHFPDDAWFRAVYADETPVGFIMMHDNAEEQEYFLWRFMIGAAYHGKGFARRAIELLAEYVKTRPGATELLVSCGQGEGSPEGIYLKMGFRHNGKQYGDEIGLCLPL